MNRVIVPGADFGLQQQSTTFEVSISAISAEKGFLISAKYAEYS